MNMRLALLVVALSLCGSSCIGESSSAETYDDEAPVVASDPGSGGFIKDSDDAGGCGTLTQQIELVAPDGSTYVTEVLLPCTTEPFDRGDPPPDEVKDPGSEKEHILEEIVT